MGRKSLSFKKIWAFCRAAVLARDDYKCVLCGRRGRLEVDHIVPVSVGGARYDTENLQALCRGCHIKKTRSENLRSAERAEWKNFIGEKQNDKRTTIATEDVRGSGRIKPTLGSRGADG